MFGPLCSGGLSSSEVVDILGLRTFLSDTQRRDDRWSFKSDVLRELNWLNEWPGHQNLIRCMFLKYVISLHHIVLCRITFRYHEHKMIFDWAMGDDLCISSHVRGHRKFIKWVFTWVGKVKCLCTLKYLLHESWLDQLLWRHEETPETSFNKGQRSRHLICYISNWL